MSRDYTSTVQAVLAAVDEFVTTWSESAETSSGMEPVFRAVERALREDRKERKRKKRARARVASSEYRSQKVCIYCERESGLAHRSYCPAVTGTLSSLPRAGSGSYGTSTDQ